MSRTEDAILEAVRLLAADRPTVATTATEIVSAARASTPSVILERADVEEIVRHMSKDRYGLRIVHAEGDDLMLRILPEPQRSAGPSVGSITVHSGNVQVGDFNQMQFNANSFGSVLVEMRARIGQAPLPPEEKKGLLDAVGKLLEHPLAKTLIAVAASSSTG